MPPGGYFGRALVVDLGDAGSATLPLDDAVLRATLGGVGLGTHLLSELAPAGVDPLAPEAPLAFVFSPLVGTPLTTSAKFAVVAKSPLTDRLNDALASSHFAIAGKLTGNDAIVVRGACDDAVGADRRRRRRAPRRRRRSLGPARRGGRGAAARAARPRLPVAAIGPAGERLVRYATVSHDGRHAGRGGLGAVLGAKRLKAIAVRASDALPGRRPGGGARRRQGPARALVRARDREVPRARHALEPARVQRALGAAGPQLRRPRRRRSRSRTAPPCATAARRARSAASGS